MPGTALNVQRASGEMVHYLDNERLSLCIAIITSTVCAPGKHIFNNEYADRLLTGYERRSIERL